MSTLPVEPTRTPGQAEAVRPAAERSVSGGAAGRRVRQARSAVAAFFLINGAAVGAWVPHLPDRARELHLNPAQLGAVLLTSGLGATVAMPLAGALTTRLGSRAVSRIAALLLPLALLAVVVVPSTPLLAVALFCFGISGATMDVAMNSQGIAVEEQLGRRTISLLHGMWSIGAFLGSAITSSLLAHHFRAAPIVMGTSAVLLLGVAASSGRMLSREEEGTRSKAHSMRPRGRLLLLGLLVFAAMISEGSIADWSGVYLRIVRELGSGVVGYGYTAFAAAMVVGRVMGDGVVARIGEVRALLCGSLGAAAGLTVVLMCASLPLELLGFAAVGLGLANASPVLYRAAGQVPGVAPGAGIATAVGLGYVGLLAGPPALGFLGKQEGVGRIFIAVIGLCCLVAAASPLLHAKSALTEKVPADR